MKELLWAIVLGIVEGVTEFLPVSSTGHLLLCEIWMGIKLEEDKFWKMFAIFIQIGAILAVVVYFRKRIGELMQREMGMPRGGRIPTVWLVLLATVPVMVVGKLAKDWVDRNMSTPTVIAAALGIGGVLMLLIEWFRPRVRTEKMEQMGVGQALVIGCAQCLAVLFPGTSRSAATIMSGLLTGLSREAAAEFSFFLAIPAMFMAATYSLYKHFKESTAVTGQQIMLLTIGTLVSFLVAWVVIAGFMAYIRRRSFAPFAWYRILLAIIVLAVVKWM